MSDKHKTRKIIYINIMFLISFLSGIIIAILILVNHSETSKVAELEIIKDICSPMVIIPAIGWLVECLALFGMNVNWKNLSIGSKKDNKKTQKKV